MNFKLKGNRVIGVPLEETTYIKKGHVIIPIAFKDRNTLQPVAIPVRIIAIGDKFQWINEVRIGSVCFFSKYFGDELTVIRELVNEPKARLYHGSDCLGIYLNGSE